MCSRSSTRCARSCPSDLTRADALLADAEGVSAEARRQGEEIIAGAHEEKMRLVSETEVQAQAEREAGRIIAGAEAEAERMQREIDDYIDAKLANFELVLTKTLEAVARGRDKIAGRRAVEELSGIDLPDFDEGDGDQEHRRGRRPGALSPLTGSCGPGRSTGRPGLGARTRSATLGIGLVPRP